MKIRLRRWPAFLILLSVSATTLAQDPITNAVSANGPAFSAAQRACLQEKTMRAQEAQKKRRGFGRLLNAVGRVAHRSGNYKVVRTVNDVAQADATVADLLGAARDLGVTEDAIEACRRDLQ